MNIALIQNTFVESVIVSELEFAQTLGYDLALEVTPANRVPGGWLIGGVTYLDKPPPAEVTNEKTVREQAEAALAANRTAIAQMQAFIAANPGTMNTAQLSNAMRANLQQDIIAAQQRNGIIRTLLNKFDGTD